MRHVFAVLSTILVVAGAAYVVSAQMAHPDFEASRHISELKYDPAIDPKVGDVLPGFSSIFTGKGGGRSSSSIQAVALRAKRTTHGT